MARRIKNAGLGLGLLPEQAARVLAKGLDLAVRPFQQLRALMDAFQPEAIHIATEWPLGWAARKYCLQRKLPFTTAFHTRFPEVLQAALRLPLFLGYALFRKFHAPSAGVMVPTQGVKRLLEKRGFKNLIVLIRAYHRTIGRHNHSFKTVDLLEFVRFRVRSSGHTRQLLVHPEKILESD